MKAKKIFLRCGLVFFILLSNTIQAEKRVVIKKSRKSTYQNNKRKAKNNHHKNMQFSGHLKFLPNDAISIKFKGKRFHYHKGRYFRQTAGNFISVIPPIGIRLRVLPRGHITFVIDNMAYYYFEGIYYTQGRSHTYEVVGAPIGAIVYNLPPGAEFIRIKSKPFYECNFAIYKKIRGSYGHAYKVVGRLETYGNHY